MVRICVFPGCGKKMKRYNPESFHRFPLRYKSRSLLNQWLLALNMDIDTPEETLRQKDYRVCSAHFHKDDYVYPRRATDPSNPQRLQLKKYSVPRADNVEAGGWESSAMELAGVPQSTPIRSRDNIEQSTSSDWSSALTVSLQSPELSVVRPALLVRYRARTPASKHAEVTVEIDGQTTDAAVDAEDSELAGGSSPPSSEGGEEEDFVTAEEETENQETELKESSSDSAEVKTEEEFELHDGNIVVKEDDMEESFGEPDESEDATMDETSNSDKESKTDKNTNSDSNSNTETSTRREARSHACKMTVSTAEDLDEMMDIGTVDQMEQEAQMKKEELENSSSDSVAEDNSSVKQETDEKPTVMPPPADEDVKVDLDQIQSSSSPSSVVTVSTGRDSSSPSAMMNGMKVVKFSIPRLDTEEIQATTQSIKTSTSPPLVKVKDEPVDEEYDQALLSSPVSSATVKDEPNTAKDDLRIGSVFSVTPETETQSLPIIHPPSSQMSCTNCKKSLMKGQTAFQRKGSPALFCSTTCLTTSLPSNKGVTKICHNCQKLIFRPQDVILSPDPKGAMKDFCSQTCLTSFNYKKNPANLRKAVAANKPPQMTPQFLCSMCTRYCISKHEVILSGAVHKICSDACFNRFRAVNNLSMAGCANCGSYCHSKPVMLKMDDSSKTLCNAECLTKYKEKMKITHPCTMCRTTRLLAEMVDNKNSDDTVNLFCSSSCLMAFKVQTVSTSGARLNCDSCGKNTVPAYHLAMSDTSIRNFCTLPCVMIFQEKFKKSQKQVNVFTKLPMGSTQIQTVAPTQHQQNVPKEPPKLNCSQCSRSITYKPELIQIKDKLVFVCGVECSHEFKRINYVASLCEYCKIEKITRDAKRINNKDCYFCSDGCKLLFRHDLTKNWGKHCHSCAYCHSVSKKVVTAQYGGSTEEFCSEDCRSRYTMLFCHVAKCDTCGHKGKLKQSLPMLGEVKHFCDTSCLLQFCSDKVATQGDVLEDLIPNLKTKDSGHISIQTETTKPPQKILKNKALLCRPLVQNKGISCKTQTADVEAQTDDLFPKVMIVPVPVPVYVPVPMNMYSQCTPKPVGVPLPLPVPMFLPVTMDSAERIVETIQEIKEKIPSDPYEAELILMAEMVAEQDEKNDKQESAKEKVVEKKKQEKNEAPAPDDTSNLIDDLDADELDSLLNNWDDTSSDTSLRSPSQSNTQEKLNPTMDVPVVTPSEPQYVPPPACPPGMDIEADFTVETLEKLAQQRDQERAVSPPATSRRRQAHRKAREKINRKATRSSKAAEKATSQRGSAHKAAAEEIPKLKSEYGVDAWKRWVQWRQTQPNLEKPRYGSRPMELKEDVLRCATAELSYGLCCFISEVKRPNGEPYSPDSLFYLCLGIQQYLFENGRVENIFMDRFYNKFSNEFTSMLKGFTPSITASGYIHSRVEEEFLWGCKQLGAYSPIVLLNTLLFFCCKYFGFTTVEQHRQLSFAHVMRCTKTNTNNTKTTFLRFYPPLSLNEADTEVPAKKRKEEENKEDILEMMENTDNPLRCPVRLYEFYLSKCSESVKQRTNLFYLHPERSCVPNSPLWFSSTPLDDNTMEAMLTRILTVRELHLKTNKDGGTKRKTPEDEEDEESE